MDKKAYDNIKVVVRSRPLNEEEKRANTPVTVQCDGEQGSVSIGLRGASKKKFTYDMVFGPHSTQADVYTRAIRPVVNQTLDGFNTTIFAYGQTGTGKTHTMEGVVDDPELCGMIPRATKSIFESLAELESAEYTVKVSFLELYNEELQDLLSVTDEAKLRILDDKSQMSAGVMCHNLEQVMVTSTEEVIKVMKSAMAKRKVGETQLNKASSRSHCIFTLTLHIKETTSEGEDLLKVGKLNLVDLAGSECIGRSGAKNARAREAGQINKSLLTLGRVISALVEKTPHIPYRDSKLTRLLQESLGGRCKTCIIATVAPSVQCAEETLSTLEYANRAKNIKNKPEVNQRLTKRAMIKEYAEDVERLRQELASARAKDGVYISEERYDEMIAQIESQKIQIEEFEELIEVKLKEFEELKVEFEKVSELLEQTKAELLETTKTLKFTEIELDETKETLKSTEIELDETKVLLKSHEITEVKLRDGTRTLQDTLKEAKVDNIGLHEKIIRKTDIESKNKSTTEIYENSTLDSLKTVTERSDRFVKDQIDNHDAITSSLKKFSISHTSKTDLVLSAVEVLGANAQENISILHEKNALNMLDVNVSDLMKLNEASNKNLNKCNQLLDLANQDMKVSLDKLISTVLIAQKEELFQHTKSMQSNLDESKKNIENFVKNQQAAMENVINKIGKDAETNRLAINKQFDLLSNFATKEQERINSATNALLSNMTNMISLFKEDAQKNLKDISAQASEICKTSIENVEDFESETKKIVEQNFEETQTWCNQKSKSIDEINEKVVIHDRKISDHIADSKKVATATIDSFQSNCDILKENFDSCNEEFQSNIKTSITNTEVNFAILKKNAEGFKEEISNNVETSKNHLNVQEEETHNYFSEQIQNSLNTKDQIEDFINTIEDDTEVLSKKCTQYVHIDLKEDLPTCSTPKRKKYEFVSNIPQTEKHDIILKKYREAKEMGQADLFFKTEEKDNDKNNSDDLKSKTLDELNYDEKEEENDMRVLVDNKDVELEVPAVQKRKETHEIDEKEASKENSFGSNLQPQSLSSSNKRLSLGDVSNQINNNCTEDSSKIVKTSFDVNASPESCLSSKSSAHIENRQSIESTTSSVYSTSITEDQINLMTVMELRKELNSRNLSKLGNKATLRQRLVESCLLENALLR